MPEISASWNPSVPIRLLGHLPGDRDDRHRVHVGVGDRGDQVGRTRAAGGHAHPDLPGGLRVPGGRRGPRPARGGPGCAGPRSSRAAGRRRAGSRRRAGRTPHPRRPSPAPGPGPGPRSSGSCPGPPGWGWCWPRPRWVGALGAPERPVVGVPAPAATWATALAVPLAALPAGPAGVAGVLVLAVAAAALAALAALAVAWAAGLGPPFWPASWLMAASWSLCASGPLASRPPAPAESRCTARATSSGVGLECPRVGEAGFVCSVIRFSLFGETLRSRVCARAEGH